MERGGGSQRKTGDKPRLHDINNTLFTLSQHEDMLWTNSKGKKESAETYRSVLRVMWTWSLTSESERRQVSKSKWALICLFMSMMVFWDEHFQIVEVSQLASRPAHWLDLFTRTCSYNLYWLRFWKNAVGVLCYSKALDSLASRLPNSSHISLSCGDKIVWT